MTPVRILLVEDNPGDAFLVRSLLAEAAGKGLSLQQSSTLQDALRLLRGDRADVVLLDLSLPDAVDLDGLKRVQAVAPAAPIVVLTGNDDDEIAVRALKAGAQDYLVKGRIDGSTLERAVRYAIERKRMLECVRVSEERLSLAMRASNEGLWDWDLPANRIFYSSRWRALLGLSEEGVEGDPAEWFNRVHENDLEPLRLAIAAHLQGLTGHLEHEFRVLHNDGSHRYVLCRGLALENDGKPYRLAGSLADVTTRRMREPLTGLPSRQLLLDRLERAISRFRFHGQRFAVLFVDLDRFQVVNQGIGNARGDQLLVQVAERLEHCLRRGDTVARLNADEFVILQEEVSGISDAMRLVGRIRQELSEPLLMAGRELVVTASVGITLMEADYGKPEELVRHAEAAMKRAKSRGKGQHDVFDPGLYERSLELLQLELDLRRAVERGQFELFLQPIVELGEGRICGAEALLRWPDKARGMIAPADFIPLAEETGLIIPLGEWVFAAAFDLLRRIQERPPWRGFWISVNLSPRQFRQPDLVDVIRRISSDRKIDPRDVRIEITESVVIEEPRAAAAMLAELRSLGFHTAMDDFGTGFSSLTHLHQLPLHSLKLDRAFVARIEQAGEGREVARAIVNLAHSLNMDVVAEGVETSRQLAELRTLGCNKAQGYLIARPAPIDSVEMLLSHDARW